MKLAARLFRFVVPFALASFGTFVHAQPIEAPLDCKSNAHDFIAPLAENHLIDTKPMRVEPNFVNAFRPAKGATLTAYGFKVYVALGYQKDDPLFVHGKDEPIADSAYGVIVWGSDNEVQQKVRAAGSDADVHHVAPFNYGDFL